MADIPSAILHLFDGGPCTRGEVPHILHADIANLPGAEAPSSEEAARAHTPISFCIMLRSERVLLLARRASTRARRAACLAFSRRRNEYFAPVEAMNRTGVRSPFAPRAGRTLPRCTHTSPSLMGNISSMSMLMLALWRRNPSSQASEMSERGAMDMVEPPEGRVWWRESGDDERHNQRHEHDQGEGQGAKHRACPRFGVASRASASMPTPARYNPAGGSTTPPGQA